MKIIFFYQIFPINLRFKSLTDLSFSMRNVSWFQQYTEGVHGTLSKSILLSQTMEQGINDLSEGYEMSPADDESMLYAKLLVE